MEFYILDTDNRPQRCADVIAWSEWFGTTSNRVVGSTGITSECGVSTVFLGFDHRFSGYGPPLLFETMVFGGPLHEARWRYASWDDAEIGHKAAVRKAREAIGQKVSES